MQRRPRPAIWAVVGACGLAIVEALWIYGTGISVSLSSGQVAQATNRVAVQIRQEWPGMRQNVLKAVRPLLRREVQSMVKEVTVNVGGVPLVLPLTLQRQLAAHIERLLTQNLSEYFQGSFNPADMLTPALVRRALQKPLELHLWMRVGGVPVPVTVHLGGP
jgi:hypothetical protein